MTMYKVDGNDLTAIANAIRTKTGEVGTMTVADMPTEIESISGGTAAEALWNNNDTIQNYYINKDNGAVVAFSGWNCTDFIEVTPGETLVIANGMSDNYDYYNAYYDTNNSFISNFDLRTLIGGYGYGTITIPNNAYYIRLSGTSGELAHTMFWRGIS